MPQQHKIGTVKNTCRQGDRITVYFADGTKATVTANNDIVSRNVAVIGDRAFSNDTARLVLATTTRLFKSRQNYDGSGEYPYFTVYIDGDKLISIYNNAKKIIGEVDFVQLQKVNLDYLGLDFRGTGLSVPLNGLQQLITFDQTGILTTSVYNTTLHNYFLRGNRLSQQFKTRAREGFHDFTIVNGAIANPDDAPLLNPTFKNWDELPNEIPDDLYSNSQYGVIGRINLVVSFLPFTQMSLGLNESNSDNYTVGNQGSGTGSITVNIASTRQTTSSPVFPYDPDPFGYYRTFRDPSHPNVSVVPEPPTPPDAAVPFNYSATSDDQKSWQYAYSEDVLADQAQSSNYEVKSFGTSSYSRQYHYVGAYEYFPYKTILNGNTSGIPGDESGVILSYNLYVNAVCETEITEQSESTVEFIEPIIINDYLIKLQIKSRMRSHSRTESFKATINVPYDLTNQYFPAEVAESQLISSENVITEKYELVFNRGNIGLYSYRKTEIEKTASEFLNELERRSFFTNNFYTFSIRSSVNDGVNEDSSGNSNLIINDTFTSYYCAIRNDQPVLINSGFASTSFFFSSSEILKIIDLGINFDDAGKLVSLNSYQARKQLDYVSSQIAYYNATSNIQTSTTRSSLPNDVLESYDLINQTLVALIPTDEGYFLAYARVITIALGYTDTPSDSSTSSIYQNIDRLDLEILKVEKIKPFAANTPLIFTLRGCEVFNYLDSNMISFIEQVTPGQSDRKFLAATLLPISESDTQSLCFEIIDNDIVFIGIQGGDVSDSVIDPSNATRWTQYFSKNFPSQS